MNNILRESGKTLLNAVFPENIYCICCGDTMHGYEAHGLCPVCREKMPWTFKNPFSSYIDEFAFCDVWPCVRYGFYARQIMNGLKQGGKGYIAGNVGLMMAERMLMEEELPDFLVAVPSHRSKQLKRGYNQAELLAKEISRASGVDWVKGAIIKTEATASMRMADGKTRRSMLQNSFAIPETVKEKIKGRFICLVDDVCTTGSTADACARVLLDGGAEKVALLCFASSSGYKKAEELDEEDIISVFNSTDFML